MTDETRQFLLTTAWLYAQHGQTARARVLCSALVADNPRDGVSAAALAELLLESGDADAALKTLSAARFPKNLERAEAILETRALKALGRGAGAERRWGRYLKAAKGKTRTWA